MNILFLFVGLIVGCIIALLTYFFMRQSNQKTIHENGELKDALLQQKDELEQSLLLKANHQSLQDRYAITQTEIEEYKRLQKENNEQIRSFVCENADLKSQNKTLTEKLNLQKEEIASTREELNKEFKLMANEILEEKTKKFSELNEEKIGNLLNPLKEKIQTFEKRVEDTYNQETREKASLKKELEQIVNINRQMSEDAQKLTSALKGNSKVQGDWGELQLEVLLEQAGLVRGVNFYAQQNYKTDEGNNVRPDFVINLPGDKNFIIDCKVSLTAYERYFSAETELDKDLALKEHLNSIHGHINDLSSKNYAGLYNINSPDYVFLYIPIEPALYLALQAEQSLFNFALKKNIILVSTSTLFSTMRTVSFIWKQENQKKNVLAIADESGKLYDKFVGFTNDLLKVGENINNAQKQYGDAMKKLCESPKYGDTILGKIEKIKSLGANASKNIDQRLLDRADINAEEKIDL